MRINKGIGNIQTLVKNHLARVISPGDVVVDATAGRGRDTLFLAQCVGKEGQVYAFDIQEEAINATHQLLQENNLLDRVKIIKACHSTLHKYVPQGIKAVVFNLGYLPGSDYQIVTKAETTLKALAKSLELLGSLGLIALTIYRGHQGAKEEAREVNRFLAQLPKKEFSVLQGIYLNQGEESPYWIMIEKNRRKANENSSAK